MFTLLIFRTKSHVASFPAHINVSSQHIVMAKCQPCGLIYDNLVILHATNINTLKGIKDYDLIDGDEKITTYLEGRLYLSYIADFFNSYAPAKISYLRNLKISQILH